MSYVTYSDFRSASQAEYCSGLTLTDDEAEDTRLTAAIARLTQRFHDWTNDSFESESLTLELDGDGGPRLILPKRCTAVTTLKLRDETGTLGSAETSTTYRLHSSLYATGSKRSGEFDWIDTVPFGTSFSGGPPNAQAYSFPFGPQTVQVVGAFGWTTTPGDAKRAVAILVYDHFKPLRRDLARADRYQTADASFDLAQTTPSGIPEVDAIIAEYKRESYLGVA